MEVSHVGGGADPETNAVAPTVLNLKLMHLSLNMKLLRLVRRQLLRLVSRQVLVACAGSQFLLSLQLLNLKL